MGKEGLRRWGAEYSPAFPDDPKKGPPGPKAQVGGGSKNAMSLTVATVPITFCAEEVTWVTKQELVEEVARRTETTKKVAGEILDATLDAITDILVKGDKVALVGFGTFEVRKRAARVGRNPQTGAEMSIGATKVPAFKAGKKLKDAVA